MAIEMVHQSSPREYGAEHNGNSNCYSNGSNHWHLSSQPNCQLANPKREIKIASTKNFTMKFLEKLKTANWDGCTLPQRVSQWGSWKNSKTVKQFQTRTPKASKHKGHPHESSIQTENRIPKLNHMKNRTLNTPTASKLRGWSIKHNPTIHKSQLNISYKKRMTAWEAKTFTNSKLKNLWQLKRTHVDNPKLRQAMKKRGNHHSLCRPTYSYLWHWNCYAQFANPMQFENTKTDSRTGNTTTYRGSCP